MTRLGKTSRPLPVAPAPALTLPAPLSGLLLALLLVLLLVGPAEAARAQSTGDDGQLIDRVVAIVNQEAVTYSELNTRVALITRQLGERNQPIPLPDQLQKQVLKANQKLTPLPHLVVVKKVEKLTSILVVNQMVMKLLWV